MAIKACIFDLDGTLLDSNGMWRNVDEVFLGKRGIPVPEDYYAAISTMNLQQGADYTIRRFSLRESPDAIIKEWHDMAQRAYAEWIPLKDHAAEFLKKLSDAGYGIALATASGPEYYVPALTRCGVISFFDLFVHARPGLYKGNAAFYRHCADELGVSYPSCAVFEDVYDGIRAAKEAGMTAIAVHDPASDTDRERIDALADRSILSFQEFASEEGFRLFASL